MANKKTSISNIVFFILLLAADIIIYLFLGVSQMDYEDNYDSSKGEYLSLASMNSWQLIFHFSLIVWNIFNVIGLIIIVRKLYKIIIAR